jgi:hypothetical protein
MDPRALLADGDKRGGFGHNEIGAIVNNLPPEMFMADPMAFMMQAGNDQIDY